MFSHKPTTYITLIGGQQSFMLILILISVQYCEITIKVIHPQWPAGGSAELTRKSISWRTLSIIILIVSDQWCHKKPYVKLESGPQKDSYMRFKKINKSIT